MSVWKYKIIEYEIKKMTNKEIEYGKTLHKTNSILLYYLIIICLKLNKVKFESVVNKE